MMNLEIIAYRLSELERLLREHTAQDQENFEKLHEAVTSARLDIQSLKTKAGLWGAIGGLVASAGLTAVLTYLFQGLRP